MQERLHVAGRSGHAQQAGLLVDESREGVRIEVMPASQVHEDTRVEIAASRCHDHAAGGREPHGRVHRLSAVDGGEARAAAEMGHDRAAHPVAPEVVDDELARQSVEAVALDAFGVGPVRQSEPPRGQWHGRWNAVSRQTTCTHSGYRRSMASMAEISLGRWREANGTASSSF